MGSTVSPSHWGQPVVTYAGTPALHRDRLKLLRSVGSTERCSLLPLGPSATTRQESGCRSLGAAASVGSS